MTATDGRDVAHRLVLAERLERLWADDRFTAAGRHGRGAEVRALAEAIIWASWHGMTGEEGGGWVAGRLGRRSWDDVVRSVVRDDVPRFQPADARYATTCPVPMERGPRKGQPCGKRPVVSQRVTDPATGQWQPVGWCRRHDAHADAARIAERTRMASGSVPEPLPNTGGLLPCHTPVTNWPDIYAEAALGNWKPPRVGVRADDWPVLAKVVEHEPVKLVLLHGEAQPAPPDGNVLRSGADGVLQPPERLGPGRSPLALVPALEDRDD